MSFGTRKRATDGARRGADKRGRVWRLTPRRLGAGAAVALAGFFFTIDSLGMAIASAAPQVATTLAPWNSKIAGIAAMRAFSVSPTADENSPARVLARHALLGDATSTKALNALGLQAQLNKDSEGARRIFSYSLELSRRELPARLWSIEDGANSGDLSRVLDNYDIALRTSREARETLFPALVSALENNLVRERLADRLVRPSSWQQPFLDFASRSLSNPPDVAKFFRRLESLGARVQPANRLLLVNALIQVGQPDAAWNEYKRIRGVTVMDRSRDPNFALGGSDSSLFDWSASEYASFQTSNGDAIVDVSMPPSGATRLLHQMQALPAGRYRLTGSGRGFVLPPSQRPYWNLSCLNGRDLGKVELTNAAEGAFRFAGTFVIPENCPFQTLAFESRSSDTIEGITGQIMSAQLIPLSKISEEAQ